MNAAERARMEEAKLAKAWLAGGMTPFQAARKCGFKSVQLMEDAIGKMEKLEAEQSDGIVPDADADVSRFLGNTVRADDFDARHVKKEYYAPLETWKNGVATISRYGQNGIKTPAYRVDLACSTSYLMIPERQFEDFARICGRAAGLVTDGSEFLTTELAELRCTLEQEAREHLDELKRNEKLAEENEELKRRLENAENLFRQEKEAHNILKIRMFDMLMAEKEGK